MAASKGRAVVYCRVSTDAQERDGTSLDTQEHACRAFVDRAGWQIVAVYRDTASGYQLERAGLSAARDLIRAGAADMLLAYDPDRVSRNQNHIGVLLDELDRYGARLETVTEPFENSAVGRFILMARTFAAEVEREKIAERSKRGKAEHARRGRIVQGSRWPLYGYVYDPATKTRSIYPEQAAIVGRIFAEYASGKGLGHIAAGLNRDGVPAAAGDTWYPITIRRMIDNTAYAGHTYHRRLGRIKQWDPKEGRQRSTVVTRPADEWIEIPNATPAIIDDALWTRVQARLTDPARIRQRNPVGYPLTGRLRCSRCGAAMVGQIVNKRFRYYRCTHVYVTHLKGTCDSKYVSAAKLESAIRQEVARVLADEAVVLFEWDRLHQQPAPRRDVTTDLAAIDRERIRVGKLYRLGEYDDATFERELSLLKARRVALESEAGAVVDVAPERPDPVRLRAIVERVREVLTGDDQETFGLMVEGLQLSAKAEPDWVQLSITLPDDVPSQPYAAGNELTDVRNLVKSPAGIWPRTTT